MTKIWFDHFLTYVESANVDSYLEEYTALGFQVDPSTVRHEPGLRNRFIFIGPEYLEFLWVENENLFEAGDPQYKLFRAAARPFGIGMIAQDVNQLHADWVAGGFRVPDVFSKAARDAPSDAPPVWSFQDIPISLLPGATCFAITYHKRTQGAVKNTFIHPNKIFAVEGVTFVANAPHARAEQWRDLLAPAEPIISSELGDQLQIGPHRALWLTPERFRSTFKRDWPSPKHPSGELAVLHLLATDIDWVKTNFEKCGRKTVMIDFLGKRELLITPDQRDGFIFSVREALIEEWAWERDQRTNEKLFFSS
jgi:hypothetical protein